MKINIDTSKLIKGLDKTIEDIEKGIEQGLQQVAVEIQDMQMAIIDANVGGNGDYVRTGKLKQSITIMPLEWSNGLASMEVTNVGCNYAIYNELGTGIYADGGNGRQDGWVYPVGDGTYRFTMGLPPKYFIRDSYGFYKDKAPAIVQQHIINKL